MSLVCVPPSLHLPHIMLFPMFLKTARLPDVDEADECLQKSIIEVLKGLPCIWQPALLMLTALIQGLLLLPGC